MSGFRARPPTSHERLTGLPWDASYELGPAHPAPWDVGGPQPAVVRVASAGGFGGPVLDAGCGTGENALYLATLGLSVLGIDVAETAVAAARTKAQDRGVAVEFAVADALELDGVARRFATVLDSGLFHTFDADERRKYTTSLESVAEHGAALHVLCFSDQGPDTGPHPVSRAELTAAVEGSGWGIATIEPVRIQTRFHGDGGAPAWLATFKRN